MMIKLTDDDWQDNYKPIKNHLVKDAPWDGCMFETYGPENEFIRNQDQHHVWTLIDSDESDNPIIVEGYHFVNRIGYFITKRSHHDITHEVTYST
jgi:hypothetical protein